MPDPKKILVKVPKKVDPEKKEPASENRIELTKDYSDAQQKWRKS
jgi:hypothetical protein